MERIILSLLIGAHGIGHILFMLPLFGITDWGQPPRPWWLLGDSGISRYSGGILFLIVILCYFAAVYGLWNHFGWWRTVAVIASALSMFGLILFWLIPITSPAASALAFNLLVLGALLIVHYPNVESVGA